MLMFIQLLCEEVFRRRHCLHSIWMKLVKKTFEDKILIFLGLVCPFLILICGSHIFVQKQIRRKGRFCGVKQWLILSHNKLNEWMIIHPHLDVQNVQTIRYPLLSTLEKRLWRVRYGIPTQSLVCTRCGQQ